jgi:translation elongation factor EF-1beta
MTDTEKLKKIKELADAVYYAAQQLTTDASRIHKAMDEYHKFVTHEYIEEEPVSEDLEEALENKVKAIFDSLEKFDVNDKEKNRVAFGLIELEAYAKMFYNIGKQAGAQWQKQQMIKNVEWCTIVKRDTGISLQVTDKEIIGAIKNREHVNVIILMEELI